MLPALRRRFPDQQSDRLLAQTGDLEEGFTSSGRGVSGQSWDCVGGRNGSAVARAAQSVRGLEKFDDYAAIPTVTKVYDARKPSTAT